MQRGNAYPCDLLDTLVCGRSRCLCVLDGVVAYAHYSRYLVKLFDLSTVE